MKYQPHIDGLRAVAVLLVIFHHLGDWGGLAGGFVGVDVFFVISGFLITSIVKSEIEAGTFSFGGFYKRRVVRLAPAYFTVVLATTVAALIWMLPAELLAYARSMIASSLFLANFHMWQEVGGYFGASAETVPLLHLWTLAVEEQFYLFWPVAMLVVHRLLPQKWRLWVLLLVVVIGTVVSQWGVAHYPAAAYYLLPTRFFELAIGALLAYLPASTRGRSWASAVSLAGMAMILYAGLYYWKETLFPGYAVLMPVLGTAMVLRWGEGTVVGKALSTSIATFIGKISYPAYLWHWPIIAFLNLNEVAITVPNGVSVVVATLMLAWMTYRCIELPARRFRSFSGMRVVLTGGAAPILASVALGLLLVGVNGIPGRFPDSLNKKSEALLASPSKARGRCNEGPPTAPLPPDQCVVGRSSGKVDFLLVGDSHANHFTGFLDVLGKDANLRGYDMTRSNTPFLPGVDRWSVRDGSLDHHGNFAPRNRYVTELLDRERIETVVLAGNYTRFYNDEILRAGSLEGRGAFESGMRAAIGVAQSSASRVVILSTIPLLTKGLHDCVLRAERFQTDRECVLPTKDYLERTRDVEAFFASLREEFPDVIWIDLSRLMCGPTTCVTEMDGTPLYKDDGHLNDIGSRLLAKAWIERFGNPLASGGVQ
ncbi:acyltransferase family protein [Luteimonas sp. MC1895]|uniref:acyltransferase family protein n=1 Tax=Luteimonas sp. MC1895 TaxID=2819513 RepID=UPI0018F0D7A2|nr:acyltransferase family protein [Luteimonas sp. MC1895]MBJ6978098.1 acyltransferase [Luteimonas sp. MC1895]